MSHQAEAEENLRVIRSLMEKATIYRAISAPGAMVAGLGALALAFCGVWLSDPAEIKGLFPYFRFVWPWLALFALTSGVNLALLAREAERRGEPFVSPGMRLALRAMLPALVGGGVSTLPFSARPEWLATFWVLFYGISLLAASHFAPKSICWLGRTFFVAGVFLLIWLSLTRAGLSFEPVAHSIMGATFGLFHLIYAACTWPRKAHSEAKP